MFDLCTMITKTLYQSIFKFTCLILLTSQTTNSYSQEDSLTKDSSYHREYTLLIAPNYDLNNSAINGLTVFKGTQDVFTHGIRPYLSPNAGNILSSVWSFGCTYLSMIWPHEFGHSLRAKQMGGNFNIHNFGLPFPYTTMELPNTATFEDQALSVTGGFEVNYLTSRKIQSDFFEYNGLYNDELSLAFSHRIMYPIYISLIIPQDPKKKETWIKTGGDPVHYIKPVWQMYSNDQVLLPDSSVHTGLVNFYNQSALFGTFWNLLDPTFYKEVGAFFGDVKEGKRPWYLLGNNQNGWSYGTQFNVSPLGYELFLNNYVKLNDKLFILSLKSGRPFKNNSITLTSPNIFSSNTLKIGGSVEVWDQARYGTGFSASSDLSFHIDNKINLLLQAGYKTKGYTLGRKINEGFIGSIGFSYHL